MRDFSYSKPLFGEYASVFGPVASAVVNRSSAVRYYFMDNEHFESLLRQEVLTPQEANCQMIREFLYNFHMAAILVMIRNGRWIEASWREYEAQNLLGWSNNMRALIESIGDSFFDTVHLAFSVAKNKRALQSGLGGSAGKNLYLLDSFENKLVHFFHGRKLTKMEKGALPTAHEAKPSWHYVKELERADFPGLYALYSRLSEISHPSTHSVKPLYREDGEGGWVVDADQDQGIIGGIIEDNYHIFHRLVASAFFPSFYALRVLAKFEMFPLHKELKSFDFSTYPKWTELKGLIDR